uniref:Uncharacterized protein n=1 Tax=Ananas comosus var. bracteatus TaxID=296719 RepID=A0A6V7NFR6_ANACO|nr:unnamed protein product [Ananas comosus var. bracteatus]
MCKADPLSALLWPRNAQPPCLHHKIGDCSIYHRHHPLLGLCHLVLISSIVLVAEHSFAAVEENGREEVSFTLLAINALGPEVGAFVVVIYISLSFSLLVACVSGIGFLITEQFPHITPILAHVISPSFVGVIIGFFPFKAIDVTNRFLCCLMLFSIPSLVSIGVCVGRRDSVYNASKAILIGGSVLLVMVLSWNAVILGLAGIRNMGFDDPIKLLLSVNPSALPAVQGFAFAALVTSLIGYVVSFPKQLEDTVKLIIEMFEKKRKVLRIGSDDNTRERSGNGGMGVLSEGANEDIRYNGANGLVNLQDNSSVSRLMIMWLVLLVPIFTASFFSTAFSKALDFSGVYANCFLFGVLPPAMAWIHHSRKRYRSACLTGDLLPCGNLILSVLFGIAVILGFWH